MVASLAWTARLSAWRTPNHTLFSKIDAFDVSDSETKYGPTLNHRRHPVKQGDLWIGAYDSNSTTWNLQDKLGLSDSDCLRGERLPAKAISAGDIEYCIPVCNPTASDCKTKHETIKTFDFSIGRPKFEDQSELIATELDAKGLENDRSITHSELWTTSNWH